MLKSLGPRRLEAFFQGVMIFGIVALLQPWSLWLHRYGVTIILIGLVGFIVFIHIKSKPGEH